MAFFALLVSIWLLLWLLSKFIFKEALHSHEKKARIAFAAGFVYIGIIHLMKPASLTYMIEPFMPNPVFWVYFTGVFEIVAGLALLIKKIQRPVAWIIIVYLVAIFPANIYVAIHNLPPPGGLPAKPWYVWSRLLFQPVYIAWIWYAAIRRR